MNNFCAKASQTFSGCGFLVTIMISALLACSSCKTPIQTVKIKESAKKETTLTLDTSPQNIYHLLRKHEFSSKWINARANVRTEINGNSTSFNITLKMQKDSVIWIYISPLLGLEAARVIITRDSLKFLDRVNKKYQLADYKFLRDLLRINLNFDIVQAMLLGNFFSYRNENKFASVYLEDRYFILSTLSKHKLKRSLEEKDPNKPVIQDMWIDDEHFRIIRNNVEDNKIDKKMEITYSDYKPTAYGYFPYKCITDIRADKTIRVEIEYNKLTLGEEQEFPFTIPDNYEKMH